VVIDLCAAPGSWLQVARKYCPVSSLLVGVDLDLIKAIPNVTTFEADITTTKCRSELKKHLKDWKADVVLHDGAPNVGTAWLQDAYSQAELVLSSLKLATEFLRQGGTFVTKIFRSQDYNSLIWVFNQLFRRVEATKPQASRNTSAEIFVVCQGYLDPKKIDPKFLDPKFVFKELDEPNRVVGVFDKQPRKPSREGYESGAALLYKKTTISDFIASEDPVHVISENNQLLFDENSTIFQKHPLTTNEIRAICDDIKVHGRADFKHLLRWRAEMVKYKEKLEKGPEDEKEDGEAEVTEISLEQQEELLDQELETRLSTVEKKKSKDKKKAADKRRKQQVS